LRLAVLAGQAKIGKMIHHRVTEVTERKCLFFENILLSPPLVEWAKYHTVGCGPTIACGSMLSELVLGRSIAECRELTAEHLIETLDVCHRIICIARRWRLGLCGML
jgi:NifU-like N terminal domain